MAKDTAHIYRHIRIDKGEPFYIGVASSLKRAYSKNGRNNLWHKIVEKSQYEVEIMLSDIPYKDALKKEIEFINLYGKIIDNTGTLCNITNGGEGMFGVKINESTRLKKSKKLKGRILSDEHKNKISNSHKGKKIDILHNIKLQNGRIKNQNRVISNLKEKNKKKVIDENTGIIYESATEAALLNSINRSTMYCYLCGINKSKTNFKYV